MSDADLDPTMGSATLSLMGWEKNEEETNNIVYSLPHPEVQHLPIREKETLLYIPLLQTFPDWKRGAQGIGDCTSWGEELKLTLLLCVQYVMGQIKKPVAPVATEPLYGLGRVEVRGGRLGGYSDGCTGASVAKGPRDWGVLLRDDYSKLTGNPEHDLRTYSSKKAKEWGNFGCGGKRSDPKGEGDLDKLARLYPAKEITRVNNFEQAAAMIESGRPVSVASNRGFRSIRDSDGFALPKGNWPHEMCFIGVRYNPDGLLLCNQWPEQAMWSGEHYPDNIPAALKHCTAWVYRKDVDNMLGQGDSFAASSVEGFPAMDDIPDWSSAFDSW